MSLITDGHQYSVFGLALQQSSSLETCVSGCFGKERGHLFPQGPICHKTKQRAIITYHNLLNISLPRMPTSEFASL